MSPLAGTAGEHVYIMLEAADAASSGSVAGNVEDLLGREDPLVDPDIVQITLEEISATRSGIAGTADVPGIPADREITVIQGKRVGCNAVKIDPTLQCCPVNADGEVLPISVDDEIRCCRPVLVGSASLAVPDSEDLVAVRCY